ncbi:hypothetical protein [Kaistia sp. 32K]|uniref:hypothetical protein n=1 Tax=Kaistia sp. 32K TaxID=2795690 RepID=UPI0019162E5A|nr:hypothetical protein [Kaistia sp. 32K]
MARVVKRACNRLGFARNQSHISGNRNFRDVAERKENFASTTLMALWPSAGAGGKHGMTCNAIL